MTAKTKRELVVLEPVADGRLYPVQSGEKVYYVHWDDAVPECDCPHYRFKCAFTSDACKHIRAVRQFLEAALACPFCHGKGWLTVYAPFPDVLPNGTLSTEPLACIVCEGSGRRQNE